MRRTFFALALGGVVAVGCGGGTTTPSRAIAAEPAQLAVGRVVAGNPPRRDVVVVTAAGNPVRRLTTRSAPGSSRGSWSPDGARYAYAGATRRGEHGDEGSDIFVVGAAGSTPRRLTDTEGAFAPVWSPDGRTIAFAEYEPGPPFPPEAAIWSMSADGGDRRRLTEPAENRLEVPFSFSPDGAQLAFTRRVWVAPDAEGRSRLTGELRLLDTRTLVSRKIADGAADPAFSPDGRRIAYVTDRDENGELSPGEILRYANELYIRELATGEELRLTRTRNLNEAAPSWSPDGSLLAYQRGRHIDNAEGTVVLTMRPDGACPRAIAFDPGLWVWYSNPVWRPGTALSSAELRCRPQARRPNLVPLAGNLSIAQARQFRRFRLYWLGRRYQELVLSSMDRTLARGPRGRGHVVNLSYGRLQLQLWPACVRVPADVDVPADARIRIRGVEGVMFEGRHRLEIVTGKTTIVIFAPSRRIIRIANALRSIARLGAPRPGERLPPPAPGATAGRLRC